MTKGDRLACVFGVCCNFLEGCNLYPTCNWIMIGVTFLKTNMDPKNHGLERTFLSTMESFGVHVSFFFFGSIYSPYEACIGAYHIATRVVLMKKIRLSS